jgi:hypothetical protein
VFAAAINGHKSLLRNAHFFVAGGPFSKAVCHCRRVQFGYCVAERDGAQVRDFGHLSLVVVVVVVTNPLSPELNPSAQRCLKRYFMVILILETFVNICVKNQQMKQLFIKFINYV